MPDPIAIIGAAGRFAGAPSLGALFQLNPRALTTPILVEAYRFDPARFGIADADAAAMDPQQRWMLTTAADAIRDLDLGTRAVGVFVAAAQLAYQDEVTEALRGPVPKDTLAGNLLSMLAARVSHTLDLRGPSFAVDAACAGSLVALHQACRALEAGDCEVAIVGGVNLNLTPTVRELFSRAGALSPTGQLRPFDHGDGTVPADGVGCVILASKSRAERRGHPVLGEVLATAVNNCGRTIGVMAPRPEGQVEVMRAALEKAGVDPSEVRFVEAHATGTDLGDKVEKKSIDAVYPHGPRVGAVKGAVGHALGAAGIAGVLSALGQLKPGELGAVNAFGFGGTNAHVILRGGSIPASVLAEPPLPPRELRLGAPAADAALAPWLHAVEPGPRFAPAAPVSPALKRRGVYVITGASGGLGRVAARTLARNARARLVLTGRRPLDAELEALLGELRALGAKPVYVQAELPAEAARVLEAAAALGPVAGLLHAAGGLSESALKAKVDGLRALEPLNPERTVLFSSVSGLIPGLDRGIEGYAEANRALDAYAREGRAAGRAITSLAFAPWAEVGMAAGLAADFAARGIEPIPAELGEAALLQGLGSPHAVVAVMRRAALAPATPLREGPADWRAKLRALIAEEAAVPEASLDDEAHLMTLGVDSLNAIEIVKALEEEVGRELPTTLLFEHDTISKLAAALTALGPAAPATSAPAAPAGPGPVPLVDAQRTFLVQQRFFPTLPCNVFLALSLEPTDDRPRPLRQDRLTRALAELVERHPVLRGRVARVGDAHHLAPGGPAPALEWVDAVDDELIANQVLDLERGPLLRVVSDGRRLALNGHHLLIDAWSAKVLAEELLALHEGAPLPPPPPSWFEIHATVESRQLHDEDLDYWRGKFAGGVPPIHLPWRSDPSAPPRGPARALRARLSRAETEALQARARAAAVSLPALVLSAYAELLFAESGQHDLTIRVAHGRRDARAPGITRAVGSFADSLPIRISLKPAEGEAERARRVQAELHEAQAHAGASSLALASLQGREAAGPQGLTPAGFSFLNLGSASTLGGLRLREVHGASASGFTRLGLIAWTFDGELNLSFNTLADHFDPEQVERFADRLRAILTAPTPRPAPGRTLDEDLLDACARYADRPLTASLRYAELDAASATLAAALADALGPNPARVAILADPGEAALTAVLAVLRAGHAWVPLDPAWPDARVRAVLEDARPAALVHAAELGARAAALFSGPRLVADPTPAETRPAPARAPGEIAWVMYTSGSTGRPKGVVVSHAAARVFLDWCARFFGFTEDEVFLQTSPLAFGGCIRQMFSPILAGARLVIAAPATKRDPSALLRLLEDERVTVYNSVPSLFSHLTDAVRDPAQVAALRWVLLGGEAVPSGLLRRWRALVPNGPRIANLYGSTETVVNATAYLVPTEIPEDEVMTPIGWARAGQEVLLLEPRDGVGEIAVRGAIAEGYLGEREGGFVDHPALGRLYRTGDLARRDARGNLVYLGRVDSQVQVWGNRVELGEIEATLCAFPGVRAAMVKLEEDRLIARVEAPEHLSTEALRDFVSERLPSYMVPHRVERMEQLPRTAAGKTDRRAPIAARASTLTEQARAAWREVLRLDAPPDDDAHFFRQGGDSMLAIELAARLREATGRPLSPLALHRRPTLEALVALLEKTPVEREPETSPPPIAIEAAPLGPVQRGFWLADRAGLAPVMVTTLPLEGPVDLARLRAALERVQARHPLLRARFEARGGNVLQRPGAAPPVELQYDDLRPLPPEAADAALRARIDEERALRFDPTTGPLVRLRLCQRGDEDHILLLTAHHILLDAHSAWLLLHELLDLHAHDRPPAPPEHGYVRQAAHPRPAQAPDPFWNDILSGLPPLPAPDLAGDHRATVRLSARELERLRARARTLDTTPFALVFSAFSRALLEETHASELIVSTAVTGRPEGAEEAVGPFAHGVPVRASREEAETRAALAASLAHADSALDTVPRLLGPAGAAALGRFFLSWLEPPTSLGASAGPRPRWDEAELRFQTASTATEVSAAALAHDGLTLSFRGGELALGAAQRTERYLQRYLTDRSALILYAPGDLPVPLRAPTRVETVSSAFGETELILLPSNARQLRDPERLRAELGAALASTDAEVVALAGMLPSLTGLGREELGARGLLTTGHAATVVAMLKTTERALAEVGSRFADRRVGVLGFGAIGQASLALCVARLGAPRAVQIADPRFGTTAADLVGCDLILGATSGGRALEVDALAPGTLVVDDSFPRAFDDDAAWRRMEKKSDVLLCGGGSLDVGPLERRSPFPEAEAIRAGLPTRWLPGCHAEAVLVAARPELGPTVGPVELPRALRVLEAVDALGWTAPPLHLGARELPAAWVQALRQRRSA